LPIISTHSIASFENAFAASIAWIDLQHLNKIKLSVQCWRTI